MYLIDIINTDDIDNGYNPLNHITNPHPTAMTAQEKAQELINKFSPLVTTWDCYWDTPRNDDDIAFDAKRCALIAVDELINDGDASSPFEEQRLKFWIDVKKEINK